MKFILSLVNRRFFNQRFQKNFMEVKKLKMLKKKIGTHDGNFHCDEILACYMLQQLDDFKDAEILRTRDLNILKTCDIVVDVGREFNVKENKFDHHQNTFNETLSTLRPELGPDYKIRLSSAGLIYTYFGEKIISNILNKNGLELSNECLQILYKKVYKNFIEEIDAIDNGIQICDGEPYYHINSHLSSRVGKLNPAWNCTEKVDIMKQFEKSKLLAGKEFEEIILNYANVWLPARKIVEEAIKNAEKIYETGEIIELARPCPWKEHLFILEKEYNLENKFKYVLFKSSENDWRVECVPRKPNSFICRKFLHKDWRGANAEVIAKLSGINDAQFCHANGFIGGALSREGVLQMAIQSLKENE